MTCVIQITGGKDVGKTALAERIIKRLKQEGRTVVAVKLSHHEPEPPTKDTHRLRRAGADRVLFYNGDVFVLYTRAVDCGVLDADYVVVEGLRDKKVGYKIHVGPNAPDDADLVVKTADEEVEIVCIDKDPCDVLKTIASHRPRDQ